MTPAAERWFVVDKNGERIAGPYKTSTQAAVARIHLEQMEREALGLETASDG